MKKAIVVSQVMLAAFCLSGCSQYDGLIQKQMEKRAGIDKSSEYALYNKLSQNQEIDDEGYYRGEQLADLEEQHNKLPSGQVQVSLATNSFLKMKFYTDPNMQQEINASYCYMNPGDSLYASQVDVNNERMASYVFLEYQIYEVTEENEYSLLGSTNGSINLVYTIPDNFKGSKISIVPVGEYQTKKLNFNTYYADLEGKHEVVSSVWKVNDEIHDKDAEVDARESYTVKCEYDAEEYYFVNSIPSCFSHSQGCVEFPKSDSQKNDSSYEVELHKYMHVKVDTDDKLEKAILLVNVDNEKQTVSEKISNLKLGQIVYLEVNPEFRVYSDDVKISKPEKKDDKLAYKFEVTDAKSNQVSIEVNKKYEVTLSDKEAHGECKFLLDGKPVSGTVLIRDGQKLEMQYTLTDDNYRIKKGFFEGLFDRKNIIEEKIKITSELDGKTIVAEDYIEIEKKGAK
ncbi:MAG: hypothetical protein Q4D51_10955 [Eubacteriales bacterium]|nr:hypothetical protein [Eubacteriales bacterium]